MGGTCLKHANKIVFVAFPLSNDSGRSFGNFAGIVVLRSAIAGDSESLFFSKVFYLPGRALSGKGKTCRLLRPEFSPRPKRNVFHKSQGFGAIQDKKNRKLRRNHPAGVKEPKRVRTTRISSPLGSGTRRARLRDRQYRPNLPRLLPCRHSRPGPTLVPGPVPAPDVF